MEFDLEQYLSQGVVNLVKGIAKASLENPKASIFMTKYILANRNANQKRKEAKLRGEQVPPFLIASITTRCNLHCKGCYARANHNCVDQNESNKVLSANDWNRIFDEAQELGVSFVLLAGGEPFMRPDVLEIAGAHKKILFPIFTNGTMITKENQKILQKYPNLLPVLSLEGSKETTDARRGSGTYEQLSFAMKALQKEAKVFGSSITVQKNNLEEVTSDRFIENLIVNGCKAVVYVEYVPVDRQNIDLAPGDKEREYMTERLQQLRLTYKEMIFVSFPGDEKATGGCLAAGRGFFHINAYGGAEPCPFSAYSDSSLKEMSLKEALQSPLFVKLRESGALEQDHSGGCTLFQQEKLVQSFI